MTKMVPLSNGRGVAIVDDGDYAQVMQHTWRLNKQRDKKYAQTDIRNPNGTWVSLMLHQAILGPSTHLTPIDHINDDGLDNQRANLRYLSNSNNVRRSRKCRSVCGLRGVSQSRANKVAGTYQARISINRVSVHLGTFTSAEAAGQAYENACASLLAGHPL